MKQSSSVPLNNLIDARFLAAYEDTFGPDIAEGGERVIKDRGVIVVGRNRGDETHWFLIMREDEEVELVIN